MEPITFKRWSKSKYAVLQSLNRVIRIGILSVCYTMLQTQPALAQNDTLSPSMIFELEEVETTAEVAPEVYSTILRQVAVIQQEQILSSAAISPNRILDKIPGIDIRTRGALGVQSDLNIQGGSFDQSLVLINGINFSNPQTGHFNLDIPLALSQLNKIEILKGSATRVYGKNAYSGAVNFITNPADSLSFSAEARIGQYNLYSTSASIHLPLGKSSNLISTTRSGSDGYRQNTDFADKNIFFHHSRKGLKLKNDLFFGWNDKSFGANAFYTPKFPEQYEETSTMLMGMKIASTLINPNLQGNIYWKKHKDHFLLFRENPAAYENFHASEIAGAEIKGAYSSSLGRTSAKIGLRHERIFSTTLGEKLDQAKEIKNHPQAEYDNFAARSYISGTVEHDIQIGKILISTGTLLHLDKDNLFIPELYPGIDISYNSGQSASTFLSINRSMRLPTFTDLYYQGPQNIGNPDLLTEKSLSFESGFSLNKQYFNLNISAFYRIGRETIDWIWIDDIWQTKNITELNTYGTEGTFSLYPQKINAAFKSLQDINISYSYTEISKSNDAYISNYALDNLKHKLVVDLNWNLPFHLFLNTQFSWFSRDGSYLHYESPGSIPYSQEYSGYTLFDITGGIKIKQIKLFMDASNLLNINYRDIGSVLMPGRWISFGVKFMP